MIDFISSWTQGIIVAVIVATIIEMIIPNGTSKKYIKVVIGVYVLFNIIAPVINKVSNRDIDLTKVIDVDAYSKQIENNNTTIQNINSDNIYNIKELYLGNLKKDIKAKIQDKGYDAKNIEIKIENNEDYTIQSISLTIVKQEIIQDKTNGIANIEPINIIVTKQEDVSKDEEVTLSEDEIKQIKQYLSEIYSVNVQNITLNGGN